jgi:hypothetical protein
MKLSLHDEDVVTERDEIVNKYKTYCANWKCIVKTEFGPDLDSKATELKSFYAKWKKDGMEQKALNGLFEKNLIGLTAELESKYFPKTEDNLGEEEAKERGDLFKAIMGYIAKEVHKKEN